MDFPITLEQADMVEGLEEVKQEIEIQLKQRLGSILHNLSKGSLLEVHSATNIGVLRSIELVFATIPGVVLGDVYASEENLKIDFVYNGEQSQVNISHNL